MLDKDDFYTIDNVVEILAVTPRNVRNYLKEGLLKGQKIGGQWRFTKADVLALFNRTGVVHQPEGCFDEAMEHAEKNFVGHKSKICVCAIVDLHGARGFVAEKAQKLCSLFSAESNKGNLSSFEVSRFARNFYGGKRNKPAEIGYVFQSFVTNFRRKRAAKLHAAEFLVVTFHKMFPLFAERSGIIFC